MADVKLDGGIGEAVKKFNKPANFKIKAEQALGIMLTGLLALETHYLYFKMVERQQQHDKDFVL